MESPVCVTIVGKTQWVHVRGVSVMGKGMEQAYNKGRFDKSKKIWGGGLRLGKSPLAPLCRSQIQPTDPPPPPHPPPLFALDPSPGVAPARATRWWAPTRCRRSPHCYPRYRCCKIAWTDDHRKRNPCFLCTVHCRLEGCSGRFSSTGGPLEGT